MSDEIVVKQEPRELHPEGQFAAVCVDLIALGMRVNDFQGHESAAESCVFVFVTGEVNSKGFAFSIPYEVTVSTSPKAKLMKLLKSWRGKDFTPEELGSGFTLSAYVGKPALVSLIKKFSKAGNPRIEIETIMPLPKQMPVPQKGDYKRQEFWATKKLEYASAYQKYLGKLRRGEPDEVEIADDETAPF